MKDDGPKELVECLKNVSEAALLLRSFITVLAVLCILALSEMAFGPFDWLNPPDNTDPPGERSGLILYKDHGTGIEYLGTVHGGLIERVVEN